MATPSNLSEQILALPNGAGSVQSAGQTFQVRPYTGTGSFVIPIETKPGHAGIAPTLSLTYSTHAGSGIAGVGWSLGLASIERRTDKGLPIFDDQVDTFTLQGDELLPVGGSHYRLRVESRFARIRHVREDGRNFWVVTERDGTRVFYGLEPDHRLHDDAGRVGAWYPSKKQDANGNEVIFSYGRDVSTRDARLSSVKWAGCYRVSLTYEERPDPIHSFRPGFEHLQRHRLIQVNVEVRMQSNQAYYTYRTYGLSYAQSPLTGRSLLTAVGVTGVSPDGSRQELPVLNLGYTQPELEQRTWHLLSGALPGGSLRDRNLTLVRQSGSGLPDILETTLSGHWLRENLGNGQFGSAKRVASPVQVLLENAGTFISDMDGDGWGDLVVNGGGWVYRGIAGGGWGMPYPSTQAPAVDLEGPDVRVADLNADGLPDALRVGVGSWVYFQNLGEGRWAPGVAVLNPPPLRLDDPRVHLADINGDGFPDLVYMERSRVRVWPGKGLGRFGTAYELANPPDFGASFDPKAVHWADLTGSGQADLLYIQNGVVEMYFNQAGVGLLDSMAVTTLRQSSHGHVEPVDLLGTGVEGLLLTDYQERPGAWRYLELFPAGKPDLLTAIENGLGATTTIVYGSSTAYWVADKRAGKPWRSALPSPQVVVASVTVHDAVTGNRLGVTYRYHHGVYDGEEREFRGFALVEQIDREADLDDPSPLAQVLVKRWYHTGVDVDLRDQYTALPEGALADEVPALQWALRSLRGQLKREETFALDSEPRPYLVQETAYRVFAIEHAPGTQRYSFAPLPVESRMTHLERSEERRIVETTTTYDRHRGKGYGLPVEVREKAYGRRGVFSTAHEIAQTQDLERATITEYVNRSGPDGDYLGAYTPSYLVGKPARVEHYGVLGSSDVLLARVLYFYDGEAYKGLGYPGTRTAPGVTIGRLSCELVLAFTDDLLAKAYPTNTGAGSAFGASGHYLSDGAQRFVHGQRYRYDARGMLTGSLDPNGNEALLEYDAVYALFPVLYTDAVRHPMRLTRGSLPFQVVATLDANGNTVSFTYDPAGLPASKSVQGKFVAGEWIGDPPTFPTELYVYDFTTTPCKILLETRQQRLGATFRVVRYVDGLGRTIQERHDAEPDPATGSKRVRLTGWQVFNHKGLVVKAYQPVFADSDAYGEGDTTTAFVEMHYDPLGRPVRVDYPDGTFETTAFHPWVQVFFDRNDNAGHITNSDLRYGRFRNKLNNHVGTPRRTYVDALGRLIAEAQDNGSELHVTRKVLDLKNQITEVWDARALTDATWMFVYDLMGRSVHTRHTTALGDRYALADAAGNPIWGRDARGIEVIRTFDALNRPLSEMTCADAALRLRRQWYYKAYNENAPEFASNQSKNLFRQVEEERDADGLRYFEYDWRGFVTHASHRFWPQTDSVGRTWDDPHSELWMQAADWDPEIAAADRDSVASYLELPQLTDPVTLAIATKYDAAGHPTDVTYPEGMATRNSYNGAGLLESVEVDHGAGQGFQVVVEALGYNARGQLTFLKHGNGIETTREYDEVLERLTRIFTRRTVAFTTYFQDLGYGYDPVGSPMEIIDDLSESSFKDNRLIPNTRTFAYDPRYRLIEATGKKHRSVRRKDTFVLVPSPDPNDYEPYTNRYAYDAVGNLIRNQEYSTGALQYKSDRIDLFNGDADEAGTFTDPAVGNFRYDGCGNTTHTPRHDALAYTHDNQVRSADLKGGGRIQYFRHADQRVLRLVNKNGVKALTVYLGPFEYHLRKAVTGYTKLVLQVSGAGRHAQTERILAGSDPDSLPIFFHHADHLGSGHVLTRDSGDLLSQEEYFPYGNTSDRRDARNRYRYIGVERDEDTRLYMTGPRTYDCVSGRFLQPDPLAAARFDVSAYVYASATPLYRLDGNGYADGTGDGSTYSEETERPNTFIDPDALPPPRSGPPNAGAAYGGPHGPFPDDPLTAADINNYVRTETDMNFYSEIDSEVGRAHLSNFGDTVEAATVNGKVDALIEMRAQRIIAAVHELGPENLSPALAEQALTIAGKNLESVAYTTNAARAAVEAALGVSKIAGKKVLMAIPFLNAALVAQQAKEAYDKGEYIDAALLTVGIVYEPIVWGYMIADARVAWQQHLAEQTSASIDAELARLQNLDAAKLSSSTTPPLYEAPCEICHW